MSVLAHTLIHERVLVEEVKVNEMVRRLTIFR